MIVILMLLLVSNVIAKDFFPVPKTEFDPRHYICYRTTGEMKIDGIIDEDDWNNAEWTEYFEDIEGDLKPAPTYKTHIKMLWDDEYLYFAAYLEEPHVWAKLKQRDTVVYYDNDFEIFMDPDGDCHDYYEYEVNALNTVWDLLLTRPYRDDAVAIFNWDINGLKSATSVDGTINDASDIDKGWYVEVAFPWAVLKECARRESPPLDKDQWRMGFSRVEWKMDIVNNNYKKAINPKTGKHYPENNWIWSQQGLVAMHYPERWGIVQFSEKSVEDKSAKFVEKEEYVAANYLYEIYYYQKQYFMDNNKFTTKIKKVIDKNIKLNDYEWPPKIEITSRSFDLILKGKNGNKNLSVNELGRLTKF